ncbi:sugar kinase [Atlantibacter sp.]|uniref:sugar kinase n=1 Tax=Atlantibacter sp. TaxID=1903473 RepID=UPI0028AABDE1|nr:sugar kinase [Atlantibacter sp.]
MKTMDILSFGEPMFEFSEIPGKQNDSSYLSGFGGDTSNFAISAARQGAQVAMLTQLGNDVFGDRFMALWTKEQIACHQVLRHPQAPTGVYFISHDEDGHHFTFYRKDSAASLITPEQISEQAIADTRLLHSSAITHAISNSASDSLFRAIDYAKSHQTMVSFDTNLRLKLWPLARARALIHETIRYVDYCLPSLDEARLLTGKHEANDVADYYLQLGAKNVVLKMGADGAMFANAHTRVVCSGHKVETVDATGAGDCFSGAFLSRILAGDTPQVALGYANAAAALTTTGYGAVAPIPSRQQVDAFLSQIHS